MDSCQLFTIIEADVPRVKCPEHGVSLINVPWAESGSRFTALFESLVLTWITAAPLADVAQRFGLSWDEVDGIQKRGVDRGLERRKQEPVRHMGVDETSFQKGHDYIVCTVDTERNIVLDVLPDRKKKTFKDWLQDLPEGHLDSIETISMDMWPAFINASLEVIPNAKSKICFDRFHVSQYFGNAVDKVRASEHRSFLSSSGKSPLTSTKHDWLRNSNLIDNRTRPEFMQLVKMKLKTARAWAIKETASELWNYSYRGAAEKSWKRLLQWTARCRLKPVVEAGRTVKSHLWGILNAIQHKVSNAAVEGKNAAIQKIKNRACGFRNKKRFKRAILFHLGGLNVMPEGVLHYSFCHQKS